MTDSIFFMLCACFDGSVVLFDEFFAIEKLEHRSYNARTKYELVFNSTYSSDLLFILTDLTKVLLSFCVIEDFKFWVILRWMKE